MMRRLKVQVCLQITCGGYNDCLAAVPGLCAAQLLC